MIPHPLSALENNFSRHTGGDPLDTPDLEADPPQTGLERAAERLEEIGSEIKLQASKLHEATNFDDANDAKHYLEKALADLDAWLTAFNKPAAKLDPGTPDPRD